MPLYGGNSMLDCLSHLFEDKHLDLPHPLARDAEFVGEHSKRDWVFGQAPRFEDPALANVEFRQGLDQRLAPIFQLFVLDQDALLAPRVINQSILPFAGIAVPGTPSLMVRNKSTSAFPCFLCTRVKSGPRPPPRAPSPWQNAQFDRN